VSVDAELQAMGAVGTALDTLDEEAAQRVLRWAADRYNVDIRGARSQPRAGPAQVDAVDEDTPPADIHELFSRAQLRTDTDRGLMAAYWFQQFQNASSFTGQQINTELKQMGYGASNITHVLTRLIKQRPALVQQVSKSGRAKQARKTYRLTRAGLEAARARLGPHDDD
jgi:hypothetical protein